MDVAMFIYLGTYTSHNTCPALVVLELNGFERTEFNVALEFRPGSNNLGTIRLGVSPVHPSCLGSTRQERLADEEIPKCP